MNLTLQGNGVNYFSFEKERRGSISWIPDCRTPELRMIGRFAYSVGILRGTDEPCGEAPKADG